jgi:DNA-binding GntR family transcriptional regulator
LPEPHPYSLLFVLPQSDNMEVEMTSTLSLSEKAINAIKAKIQYGELNKDTIITENHICEELKISRTPVREALIQLVSDGILKKVPNKGYTVEEFDEKSKTDLYCVYSTLDALAAALSVANITDDDILKMCECVDKIDIALKYHNYTDYYTLQDMFHKIYTDKCDNQVLTSLLNELSASPVNRSYVSSGDSDKLFAALSEMNNEHRKIIDLFRERNAAKLESFLKNDHWVTKYPDLI